jgi:hypothetical protein
VLALPAHGKGVIWDEAENWQSEFLQLLTFVVLTTFLIHRNSHESRDSDDEMQKVIGPDREAAQGLGG